MPNMPSAAKRARQAIKRRAKNVAGTSLIRNVRRQLFEALEAKDKGKAEKLLREYSSILDRAAQKGTIKANTAARRKSRATQRVAALPASA